ncbi:hypothetical protein Esti_005723 [Eimeria stiedai]
MGRAKRGAGGDFGARGPPAVRVGAPQGPALCIACKGCPLSTPSRRVPSGKKPEVWSDSHPLRGKLFDDSGRLLACSCCGHHEGVQLQTVEEVATSRGRVVTTSYVFISDEGACSPAPAAAAAAAPRASSAAAGAAAAAAVGGGGAPTRKPRGSKPRELWLALSQLEGSSGYLNVASLTLGGRGPIDLRRLAAIPMRARDRGPLSPPRTLREEILLAITEGATHDLLRPARIERKDHHIRGLPAFRKKDKLDVVGCICWSPTSAAPAVAPDAAAAPAAAPARGAAFSAAAPPRSASPPGHPLAADNVAAAVTLIAGAAPAAVPLAAVAITAAAAAASDGVGGSVAGPHLGKDEVIVAGAYLGEVRYDIMQAKAMEGSSSISSSSSAAVHRGESASWHPEPAQGNRGSSSNSKSRSSSSSSSSSAFEPTVCVSPLKSVSTDYGMSCGWDSNSKSFVQVKAQRRIVFHPLALQKRARETQTTAGADPDSPRIIPSDELGLQADGTIVLPGRNWMCIDAEHYFNITSLMNDSRCILEMRRLKDTFIFHEVHYEGFPYLVLIKKQGQELLHMEECLVNCGPLFRLGHLQPLCEAALYEEADEKPLPGTQASQPQTDCHACMHACMHACTHLDYEEMPVLKLCAMDWEDRHDLMDSFSRTKRAKEASHPNSKP